MRILFIIVNVDVWVRSASGYLLAELLQESRIDIGGSLSVDLRNDMNELLVAELYGALVVVDTQGDVPLKKGQLCLTKARQEQPTSMIKSLSEAPPPFV